MSGEYARSQDQEMALAFNQKRQPMCVYCEKPLDRILQTQYENIGWEWDGKMKKYIKQECGGDSDKPYHSSCGAEDWDYVDGELVSY
jgi:hypothetical protein